MKLSLSIIICTKDRPISLQECIDSILVQTRLPDQIIIIDDDQLQKELIFTFKKSLAVRQISFVYHKKSKPGLTSSRNVGVRLAKGEIILFLDDDVVLDSEYIQETMNFYEYSNERRVFGTTGALKINNGILKNIFLRSFFLDGSNPGDILPNGIGILVRDGDFIGYRKVRWLSGCNMSFRKEVFRQYHFNETYDQYGWGEDKEFSFRVSQEYDLWALSKAKLVHKKSPISRINPRTSGFMELNNYYHFFHHFMPKKLKNRSLFLWTGLGITIKNILGVFFSNRRKTNFRKLMGNLDAIIHIVNEPK